MIAYLVTADDSMGRLANEILDREGIVCDRTRVVTPGDASRTMAGEEIDLVVFLMPSDPFQAAEAMDVLRTLPRVAKTWVMAVGPATDPRLVIRAFRGAVDDYLDRDDLERELRAALERWRTSCAVTQENGKLIVLTAGSGGCGTSTLAASIAVSLALAHHSSALLDFRLQAGDLAALLDLRPTYTLADLCQNLGRLDRALLERALVRHASGVHLLAPVARLTDASRICAEGIKQTLMLARSLFPYVVVDLDHAFQEEQTYVLAHADIILLVLRLDFATIRNTRRTLEEFDALGIPRERVQLVATRYGQAKQVPFAKAEEALERKIEHCIQEDVRTVNRANNNGVPIVLEAPYARISRSINKLAVCLNGRH